MSTQINQLPPEEQETQEMQEDKLKLNYQKMQEDKPRMKSAYKEGINAGLNYVEKSTVSSGSLASRLYDGKSKVSSERETSNMERMLQKLHQEIVRAKAMYCSVVERFSCVTRSPLPGEPVSDQIASSASSLVREIYMCVKAIQEMTDDYEEFLELVDL